MVNKRILITGGAGYIGSRLLLNLLEKGHRVNILDLFLRGNVSLPATYTEPFLKVYKGGINDVALVRASLADVSTVIYLAGVSDGRMGKENPGHTNRVNYTYFKKFVKLANAAGCERIIFASTFGVYGSSYTAPLTENLEPIPEEPYSASKLEAERFLLEEGDPGFCVVCLRIAMVFGSSLKMRDDFIVNRMTKNALQKGRIQVLGGGQKRPQIHIKDLSRLFIKMVEIEVDKISGKVFNTGAINPSIGEIAQEIKRQLTCPVKIEMLPPRARENSFLLDSSKLYDETGFEAQISLKEGIREMITFWAKENTPVQGMETIA